MSTNNRPPLRPAPPPTPPGMPETIASPWHPAANEVVAAAELNSRFDKMQAQGYTFTACIELSAGGKVLVFRRGGV